MLRRTAFGCAATSKPATLTSPAVGRARVQSMLMVVDLPAPFGPRNANTSPSQTSKLIPSTAVNWPNRLVRSRTSITLAPPPATMTFGLAPDVIVLPTPSSSPPDGHGPSGLAPEQPSVFSGTPVAF